MRLSKPARADVGTLSTAIVVKWPYESASGMPESGEKQAQLEFERLIDPLPCENDNSELVQVATGMGSKEWTDYARSRELFMERFNALLAGHRRDPVAIEFIDDPRWQIWSDMVRDLQVKGV